MEIIKKYLNQDNNKKAIPLIIFEDYREEFITLLEKELKQSILLITFKDVDWNKDFSPWPYEKFTGEGRNTIELALNEIKNEININNEIYVAGYSLGGLLALYSLTLTDNIKHCASVSGSLWYPNLIEYLNNHQINNKNIYLSLGNKEAKTKHPLMSQVDLKTKETYDLLKNDNKVFFEYNEGNHFYEANKRLLKGIKYIFENKNKL